MDNIMKYNQFSNSLRNLSNDEIKDLYQAASDLPSKTFILPSLISALGLRREENMSLVIKNNS